MKKYIAFSILLLTVITTGVFTSCKDDEPEDLIVGTWEKQDNTISTFFEGGTCVVNGTSGTWSIAGNSLTLIFPAAQPIIFNIVSITETSMVLTYQSDPNVRITYTKQ